MPYSLLLLLISVIGGILIFRKLRNALNMNYRDLWHTWEFCKIVGIVCLFISAVPFVITTENWLFGNAIGTSWLYISTVQTVLWLILVLFARRILAKAAVAEDSADDALEE